MHNRVLHISGQARRDPVAIHPVRLVRFRFKIHPMLITLREPNHLVLDARAISWSCRPDLSRKDRRTIKIGADRIMRSRTSIRLPARNLLDQREPVAPHLSDLPTPARQFREWHRVFIAVLDWQRVPIDRVAIESWWCPCFEPSKLKPKTRQRFRNRIRGVLALTTTLSRVRPAMHDRTHKGASSKHNRWRAQLDPLARWSADHHPSCGLPVAGGLGQDLFNAPLDDINLRPSIDERLDRPRIRVLVGLASRSMNRGPLRSVQKFELDPRRVRDQPHQPPHRIDLADELPLREPPNCWIAAHHPDFRGIKRHQCYRTGRSQPIRSSPRGFNTGVSAPDHDDLIV